MSEGLLIATALLGVLILFPAFWSLVVWLVGAPWRGLARDYPAESWPEDGYRLSMQSASVGLAANRAGGSGGLLFAGVRCNFAG